MKKPRRQFGVVYKASDSFYVRYWITKDGKRVRTSQLLCNVDGKHHSESCKAVQDLCADFMKTINDGVMLVNSKADIPITDFWASVYLPFIESNHKPSTIDGYTQIWNQHLADHFKGHMLREYQTSTASKFLTSLVKDKYGRRTVAHVRSLASGIFTHAINLGNINANPWSEAKSLVKTKTPAETLAYTLPELMDIINNKLTRTDARLVVCLASLMGLRPSEIVGLTWQDVNVEARTIRIRHAYVRGHLGTTKTDVDESLPMIEPLLGFMKAWHAERGKPECGHDGAAPLWVFPNQSGNAPINIRDYVVTVLRPAIGKESWKTLYAFRRGAASILTQLTGDPIAASQLLRHKTISVTMTAYIKADRSKLVDGLKLVESQWRQLSAPAVDRR